MVMWMGVSRIMQTRLISLIFKSEQALTVSVYIQQWTSNLGIPVKKGWTAWMVNDQVGT